jgi:hypothetical protein
VDEGGELVEGKSEGLQETREAREDALGKEEEGVQEVLESDESRSEFGSVGVTLEEVDGFEHFTEFGEVGVVEEEGEHGTLDEVSLEEVLETS